MGHLLTAGEAAKILDMTPGGARAVLGEHHDKIIMPSGHTVRVWLESEVRKAHEERVARGVKPRARQEPNPARYPKEYKPDKPFDFDVDRKGRVIAPKKTFRGRTCRYQGCITPVPTGKLYCDEHSENFAQMQKNVATHGIAYKCRAFK